MTRKRRSGRRRVRGSDGKLYDPKKQADNGHQAHESCVGTAARRARWKSMGAAHLFANAVSSTISGVLGAVVWLFSTLVARPTKAILRGAGSILGRSQNRASGGRKGR